MEIFLAHYAVLSAVTLFIGWLVRWVYKWTNPPCHGVLPPGSMGFPIVGETFEFIKTTHSLDIPVYYRLRWKRYGPVFKSSVFGKRVVASMDAEVNRFVFQQDGKMFRAWYPGTTNSMMGKESISSYNAPSLHKYTRNMENRLLKYVLLEETEVNVRQSLMEWATEPSIEVKDRVATMIFDLMAKKLLGMGHEKSRKLKKNFDDFLQAIVSLPVYFPGTRFYRCLQGRKNLQKVLKDLIKERLRTPEKQNNDFLDQVVDELKSETGLIEEKFALDVLSALLFAGFGTISSFMAVGMKLLTDNPGVVEALQEEHEAILEQREDISSGLSWDEYKSMTFTSQVINEIARLGNVAPGIFRETLMDVNIKGYTIPAGWLVMISPTSVHLNPELFEDPMAFDPWRWQDEAKRATMLKNFMPYGGGKKLCTGAEFSRIQIAVFLHTLVTKYRWKEVKGGGVRRIADILLPKDYHIQVIHRVGQTS
uniref:Uncharacterized protein n=1 Tax=Avena sativa TaxID=4498 RepID=A0ACD6A9E3_AVESA